VTFYPAVPTGQDITLPVPVADGGTGQTTAAAALAGLGGQYQGFSASAMGIVAWNYPSLWANNASPAVTSGTIYLLQIPLLGQSITVTNVLVGVYTAGSSLTASECWAGLYDNSGNEIGITAQQATSWESAGLKTMALASGPYPGTWPAVWVALVSNGTTNPQFARGAGSGVGAAIICLSATGASLPFAVNGTSQTTLPTGTGAFNYSNNVGTSGTPLSIWAGLS
jgi:hypothetical protein